MMLIRYLLSTNWASRRRLLSQWYPPSSHSCLPQLQCLSFLALRASLGSRRSLLCAGHGRLHASVQRTMVIPNHLLVHAAPLRRCGLPVTRAHAPHSRHVVRRISSAVPPAPPKHVHLTGSPLPATWHGEDANTSSLGRTGLCVEHFLTSLFRCSRASTKSGSAKHFSLAVINRTNVLKFCLQLRPLHRSLLQWTFHLLPGFMLRQDSCNFVLGLPCPTRPLCLHNPRIILALDPSSFCCKHHPSTANCNSNCVSLTTPQLECFTTLSNTRDDLSRPTPRSTQ